MTLGDHPTAPQAWRAVRGEQRAVALWVAIPDPAWIRVSPIKFDVTVMRLRPASIQTRTGVTNGPILRPALRALAVMEANVSRPNHVLISAKKAPLNVVFSACRRACVATVPMRVSIGVQKSPAPRVSPVQTDAATRVHAWMNVARVLLNAMKVA